MRLYVVRMRCRFGLRVRTVYERHVSKSNVNEYLLPRSAKLQTDLEPLCRNNLDESSILTASAQLVISLQKALGRRGVE